MSMVLQRIKTRGFWKLIIHPSTFERKRVGELSELVSILGGTGIHNGGYSFPFVDPPRGLVRDLEYVAGELDEREYLQSWRFYQSGQFVLYEAFIDDWLDRANARSRANDWAPGKYLSLSDSLYTFWLTFELAARLALSPAGDEGMAVSLTACGLRDRQLRFDIRNRSGFVRPPKATLSSFPFEVVLSRQDIISSTSDHAVDGARQFLSRFSWDVAPSMVRDLMRDSGAIVRN